VRTRIHPRRSVADALLHHPRAPSVARYVRLPPPAVASGEYDAALAEAPGPRATAARRRSAWLGEPAYVCAREGERERWGRDLARRASAAASPRGAARGASPPTRRARASGAPRRQVRGGPPPDRRRAAGLCGGPGPAGPARGGHCRRVRIRVHGPSRRRRPRPGGAGAGYRDRLRPLRLKDGSSVCQ
jgi:hypothetical protein